MAGSNKKLQGFEALYRAEQEKQKPVEEVPAALRDEPPASKSKPRTKKESNKVSNITFQKVSYEATTFKADRRKVKALKKLALDLEPGKKLQDLFDEALSDILGKYGREIK